jgi:hypothetical protein
VVGSPADVAGSLADVVGSLADAVGSHRDVVGDLADVVGSTTDTAKMTPKRRIPTSYFPPSIGRRKGAVREVLDLAIFSGGP